MTDAGQRFAICLAIALAAHAGLLAAMTRGGSADERPTSRTLSVTLSTRPTTAPVDTQIAALTAQTGADQTSRRARHGAARSQPARRAAPPAQSARTPNTGRITRFEMTAPTAPPADTRRPPAPITAATTTAESAQGAERRTRSARADPRAAYLQAWKQRIERRGNHHFPSGLIAGAPEQRLTLGVTLGADGQLHSLRILRSSGSTALDRAAQAIVRKASPFAPFPTVLRADNPRLTFAYDWLFVANHTSALRAAR